MAERQCLPTGPSGPFARMAAGVVGERLIECRGPELPKVHTGFRLAADVVEGVRATGKGYNARVERVLRKALAEGEL